MFTVCGVGFLVKVQGWGCRVKDFSVLISQIQLYKFVNPTRPSDFT